MALPLITVDGRFWRMLTVRWQREPLSGTGAERHGGRWNRIGRTALYLSADHGTSVAEFHQDVVRPGTLTAFDVHSAAVVDLTDPTVCAALGVVMADLFAEWEAIVALEHRDPPGWTIADRLIAEGVDGILVPSAARRGGVNLVLWRWSAGEDGATVRLIDPHGDLGG